jgi:hypothetical protein
MATPTRRMPIFRLSFDFYTREAMGQFWQQFQDMNRQPKKEDSWDDCTIVDKDSLHDLGKKIHHHLVRRVGPGNGIANEYKG